MISFSLEEDQRKWEKYDCSSSEEKGNYDKQIPKPHVTQWGYFNGAARITEPLFHFFLGQILSLHVGHKNIHVLSSVLISIPW